LPRAVPGRRRPAGDRRSREDGHRHDPRPVRLRRGPARRRPRARRHPGDGAVDLTVSAEVPPTLPRIYRPTRGAAAANGQRLASAVSERVSGKDTASGAKAQLSLTTTATPSQVAAGGQSSDRVVLSGALPTYREEIALRLYGPFRDEAEIGCDGTPYWTGTLATHGSGTYTTPAVALTQPGLYQYQETAPPDANHLGFTSPCTAPSERVRVLAAPTV